MKGWKLIILAAVAMFGLVFGFFSVQWAKGQVFESGVGEFQTTIPGTEIPDFGSSWIKVDSQIIPTIPGTDIPDFGKPWLTEDKREIVVFPCHLEDK